MSYTATKRWHELQNFERHHAVILIFLLISGIFLVNIYAFTAAYSFVREAPAEDVAVIIAPPANDQLPGLADTEATEANEEDDAEINELEKFLPALQAAVDTHDIESAVFVHDLATGHTVGVNEDTTFVAASFYKLFAAYEVARQIDLGLLSPNDATGFDAGTTSIEECLYRSLAYSDNPCGRGLRKLIGANSTPMATINEAGFVGTSLLNTYPTTSASDAGLFFEKLYEQVDFSKSVNEMLLQPLKEQQINNRLPQGVPDGTSIAHKTADLEGYSHDGGIFYTPGGDYILVVMSGPWPNGYADAPSLHIAVSKIVYEWFNPRVSDLDY